MKANLILNLIENRYILIQLLNYKRTNKTTQYKKYFQNLPIIFLKIHSSFNEILKMRLEHFHIQCLTVSKKKLLFFICFFFTSFLRFE